MALTDEEKSLVITSFGQVAVIAEQAAELFYGRLFVIAPETKILFKDTNMREQGRKLMQTLGTAVAHLDNIEALVPILHDLGTRHIAYGVKREHYQPVGEALIWTLEQGLGADFTPEVKGAWTKVYTALAGAAMEAYPETS